MVVRRMKLESEPKTKKCKAVSAHTILWAYDSKSLNK